MLLGSSVLPAMIWIGNKEVQLGTIVNRALSDSELTADQWNSLTELEREYRLVDAIYAMRAEARFAEDGGQ